MYLHEVKSIEDVDYIKTFFHDIFPEEPKYDCVDFLNSVTGQHPYNYLKYFLASFDNDIVGFCGIYSNKSDEGWLGWLGVKPQFRRKGYAKEMLSKLKVLMLKNGFRYCRLYTDTELNHNAYLLYKKLGFIEDSFYKYNFVTMVKDLTGMRVTPDKYWKEKTPLGFESEDPHHAV